MYHIIFKSRMMMTIIMMNTIIMCLIIAKRHTFLMLCHVNYKEGENVQ